MQEIVPPLAGPKAWAEANERYARLIERHRPGLVPAINAAREVLAALETLIPLWDELCARTCPDCRDICCTATRVWFEPRDLLLFHLLDLEIPPGQTRSDLGQSCRYLTPEGCSLDRRTRPWRCSWFLCQAQVDILAARSNKFQRQTSRTMEGILYFREAMEESFRAAVRPLADSTPPPG